MKVLCPFMVAVLCAGSLAISGQPVSRVPVGFVARVQGIWTRASDGKVLKAYDEIYPNTELIQAPSTSGSIHIALFSGKTWKHTCSTESPCGEGKLQVASAAPEAKGFLAFLATYFAGPKEVPGVFVGGRSMGSAAPVACVVSPDGEDLDLSSCLEGIVAGRHFVELATGSAPAVKGEVNLPGMGRIRAPRIATGSYALTVTDAEGSAENESTPVLVLAGSHESGLAPAHRDLDEALEIAKGWTDVGRPVVRQFLIRTVLALERQYGN